MRSPIQDFYHESKILITGSTGFMGKCLLEKLLRSCPTISTIYLIIRHKKGKSVNQRVEELFEDPVFSVMKKKTSKFRHKIVAIVGDCSFPNLGLKEDDIKHIVANVNIIFHAAATVKFDEKIRSAIAINVNATRDLINLGKGMKQLKAFVYISTAYSILNKTMVQETFYTPPDLQKIEGILMELNDDQLEEILPKILGEWTNTYTLTKAIAEDIVKNELANLPIVVFRPGIVIGTAQEPISGWIDNLYGPTGVVVGVGAGLLRTLLLNKEILSNVIPADYTTNCIIAAAWSTRQKTLNQAEPIFNYVSNNQNPLVWEKYLKLSFEYGKHVPSQKAIWHYFLICTKIRLLFYIYSLFLHWIPAVLIDFVLIIQGKKARMVAVYKKIHKYLEVISYFGVHDWNFSDENVRNLWKIMDRTDRDMFNFDLKTLSWNEYFKSNIDGIRLYLFKEKVDTIPVAKKRMERLRIAHWILTSFLVTAMLFLAFYVIFI